MYLTDTHRSVEQRLSLTIDQNLGAGNFFWHAFDVASAQQRETPVLFHPDARERSWVAEDVQAMSLNSIRSDVVRYASWYRQHGVTAGSRVGVCTGDGLLGLLHHIALTSLGAAPVHCNAKVPADIAVRYFGHTGISVLVGDADRLREYAGAAARLDDSSPAVMAAQLPRTADVAALAREAEQPAALLRGFPYQHEDNDVVLVSHTSGTTGVPKAPLFSHRSFFTGKQERLWNFPSRISDRMLTALPHSHSAGISYLSLALLLGLPAFILDDRSGDSMVRAINAFQPSMVLGFPLTLAGIDPGRVSAEAGRRIHTWYGMGDASHEHHIRPLLRLGQREVDGGRVNGSQYIDGLGSSEMGMVLFKQVHTPESDAYGRRIGEPAGVVREAAVLDAGGRHVPAGQPGMLGVKTPSVTPGYLGSEELNATFFRNGYFLTGDVVRHDALGRWYHLDRVPDVIECADGPAYSLPMEEVVLLATGAFDAAVIAVDDPASAKSSPAAVVLFTGGPAGASPDRPAGASPDRPAGGAPPGAGALLAACNTALQRHQLPRLRALVVANGRDELPVGPTGKVLKRQLRERHRGLLSQPATRGTAVDTAELAAALSRETA